MFRSYWFLICAITIVSSFASTEAIAQDDAFGMGSIINARSGRIQPRGRTGFAGSKQKKRKNSMRRSPPKEESARFTSIGKRKRVRSNTGINKRYVAYNQPNASRKSTNSSRKRRQYVTRTGTRRFTLFSGGKSSRQRAGGVPKNQRPLRARRPAGGYSSGGDDLIKTSNVTRYNAPAERTLNDYNSLDGTGSRPGPSPGGAGRGRKRRIVSSPPPRGESIQHGYVKRRTIGSVSGQRVQFGSLKTSRKARYNSESPKPKNNNPRYSNYRAGNQPGNQDRAARESRPIFGFGGANKRSRRGAQPAISDSPKTFKGRSMTVNYSRPSEVDGRKIKWAGNPGSQRRVNPDTESRRGSKSRQRRIYNTPIGGAVVSSSPRRSEGSSPNFSSPASVSGTIKNSRRKNIWALGSQSPRGERSTNKDIAGRKIRTREAQSPRPSGLGPVPMSPYASGWRPKATKEQRASRVRSSVNVSSISGTIRNKKPRNLYAMGSQSKKGERSTNKDIAGFRLRTRGAQSPRQSITPRGTRAKSASRKGENPYPNYALYGVPTIPPRGERGWKGDIAGRKVRTRNGVSPAQGKSGYPRSAPPSSQTAKATVFFGSQPRTSGFIVGEGSWRGDGRVRPRAGAPGYTNYRGRQKGRRFLQGGGSISSRIRNNGGIPIAGRGAGPSGYTQFSGNSRPKAAFNIGPGSFSGNSRPKKPFNIGAGSYSGNVRYRPSPKGGGSVKPRIMNNGGVPIAGRGAGPSGYTQFTGNSRPKAAFNIGPGSYAGNMRYRRPLKGGGSVKPRLRNNGGTPIARSGSPSESSQFSGNSSPRKGFNTSFGNYQGNLRLRRPGKGGGSISGGLHNNDGSPLQQSAPGYGAYLGARYQGNLNQRRIKNRINRSSENFAGNLRMKDIPDMRTDHVNFKGRYELSSLVPGYNMSYVNFQGNTRVKKGSKKGKHPSFYYDQSRISATKEKDKVVSVKLMWSKLFKKNENRPQHLDEKVKPRYSRDEANIWY